MPLRHAACFVLALAVPAVAAAPAAPVLRAARDIQTALGAIADVAYSADGRLLAAGGERGYGVWDAQTGDVVRAPGAGPAVQRLAIGGQGTLLALASGPRVRLVDLRTGAERDAATHGKAVTALAFADDGTGASGDEKGRIQLWSAEGGAAAALPADRGDDSPVVSLALAGPQLVALNRQMVVATWAVAARQRTRVGSLQSTTAGRVVPADGALDPTGALFLVAAQKVTQRPGTRHGNAHPDDMARDNLLLPYDLKTGEASAVVRTGAHHPEQLALAPGRCFAAFSSHGKDQDRLHLWGLIERGEDLAAVDLPGRATALALASRGQAVAAAFASGLVRTWTLSGATQADCDTYQSPAAPTSGPTFTFGSDTTPLIKADAGATIAVLPFAETDVKPGLGSTIAEMISGELANHPALKVVERDRIDAILQEMKIQRSGITEANAAQIGRGLNVRTVLFGRLTRFGTSTYVILARAVDVETQRQQGSRQVTCTTCQEEQLPLAVTKLGTAIVPPPAAGPARP